MTEEMRKALSLAIEKLSEDWAKRPNQFVIAYYRKDNDELIGYHYDTFCHIGKDILQAKRYAAEDPYPQLAIVLKNVRTTLEDDDEGWFGAIASYVKENWGEIEVDNIYADAIYLTEGTPARQHMMSIIDIDELKKDL